MRSTGSDAAYLYREKRRVRHGQSRRNQEQAIADAFSPSGILGEFKRQPTNSRGRIAETEWNRFGHTAHKLIGIHRALNHGHDGGEVGDCDGSCGWKRLGKPNRQSSGAGAELEHSFVGQIQRPEASRGCRGCRVRNDADAPDGSAGAAPLTADTTPAKGPHATRDQRSQSCVDRTEA